MRLDHLEFASGKARSAWRLNGSRGAVVTLHHSERQRLEEVSSLVQSLTGTASSIPGLFADQRVMKCSATFRDGGRQFIWTESHDADEDVARASENEGAEWIDERPAAPLPLGSWDLTRPDATHHQLVQYLESQQSHSTSIAIPTREELVNRATYEKWLEQAKQAAEELAELTALRETLHGQKCDAHLDLEQKVQLKAAELAESQAAWHQTQEKVVTQRRQLAERQQHQQQRQYELRHHRSDDAIESEGDSIPVKVWQLWSELAFIDQRLSGWRGLQSQVETSISAARRDLEAISLKGDPETESCLTAIRLELRNFESMAEALIQETSQNRSGGDGDPSCPTTLDLKNQCGDLYRQLHALYDRLTHQQVGLARKAATQKIRHLRRLSRDLSERSKKLLERRKRCLAELAEAGVDSACLSERSQQGLCRCATQDGYDSCGKPKMKRGDTPNSKTNYRNHVLADLTRLSLECRKLQEDLVGLQTLAQSQAACCETLSADLHDLEEKRVLLDPSQQDREVAAKLKEVRERRNDLLQRISEFQDQECADRTSPLIAWSVWLKSLSSGQWQLAEFDAVRSRIRVQRRNQVWYSWSELDPQSKSLVLFGLALGSMAAQPPSRFRWPTLVMGPESCGQQGHRWGSTLSTLAEETLGQLWLLTRDETWASRCNLGETQYSIPDWQTPFASPSSSTGGEVLTGDEVSTNLRRVILQRINNTDAEEFPGEFRDQVIGQAQVDEAAGEWTRAESVEAYETGLLSEQNDEDLDPKAWAGLWLEDSEPISKNKVLRGDWSTVALAEEKQMPSELRDRLARQEVETWGELAAVDLATKFKVNDDIEATVLEHWNAVAVLLVSGQVRSVFDARVLVACQIRTPAELIGLSRQELARRIQGLRWERMGREVLDQGSDDELLELSGWVASLEHAQAMHEFGYQDRQAMADSSNEPAVEAIERPRATIRFDAAHHRSHRLKKHRHVARRGASEKLTFYLNLSDDLEAAPAIGPKTAGYFAEIGIITVRDFLESDPAEAAKNLGQPRIDGELVGAWQRQAELVCRVPNLRGHDAQLLVACDVTTADELATWQPDELFAVIGPFSETPKGQRILRSGREPDLAEVTDWIRWAQEMRSLKAA
jgi:predicted flap endonuclease-1-like 5' DNA nuclease